MIENMLEDLELYFPFLKERMVKCYETGKDLLTLELNDGTCVLYDDTYKSFRHLPKNRLDLTEDECREEFSNRLRKLMTKKGITQSELSVATGIAQSRLSEYFLGKRMPNFYNIDKIAKALNCSVDDFRYF